jgi:hypothetical protein
VRRAGKPVRVRRPAPLALPCPRRPLASRALYLQPHPAWQPQRTTPTFRYTLPSSLRQQSPASPQDKLFLRWATIPIRTHVGLRKCWLTGPRSRPPPYPVIASRLQHAPIRQQNRSFNMSLLGCSRGELTVLLLPDGRRPPALPQDQSPRSPRWDVRPSHSLMPTRGADPDTRT